MKDFKQSKTKKKTVQMFLVPSSFYFLVQICEYKNNSKIKHTNGNQIFVFVCTNSFHIHLIAHLHIHIQLTDTHTYNNIWKRKGKG